MILKYISILFFSLFIILNIKAQQTISVSKTLNWEDNQLKTNNIVDTEYFGLSSFGITQNITTKHPQSKIISFNPQFEITNLENINLDLLPNIVKPRINTFQARDKSFLEIVIFPFKNENGIIYKLISFELTISISPGIANTFNKNTYNSILEEGNIYKLATSSKGVYKLDYNYLKNTLNIDIDNINPKHIKLFGNGGGRLPEANSAFRYDDLEENAITIVGEEDGSFGTNDYILFYSDAPHHWKYNSTYNNYKMENNIYSGNCYYYIKIESDNGLRISTRPSINNTEINISTFQDYARKELEKYNPLHEFEHSTGTGQDFVGELFQINRDLALPNVFNFPNMVSSDYNNIIGRFYARSEVSSKFVVTMGNESFSKTLSRIYIDSQEGGYYLYHTGSFESHFDTVNDQVSLNIHYNETGNIESKGYLDYIEINAMRQLIATGNQMAFRNSIQNQYNSTSFSIENVSDNHLILDVTDPTKPVYQEFNNSNNTASFGIQNDSIIGEYWILKTPYNEPKFVEKVKNQNLHGIENIQMVIIYPPSLQVQAERLALHRSNYDALSVSTININEIWNEFGSGSRDISAIRDFLRMLYIRNPDNFKYVLLFGDASFDFKNIYGFQNKNLIPTYETTSSDSETKSYPTDDFFTLMDEDEGGLGKGLDLSIGRIPVNNIEQAKGVVDKIIRYDTNPDMFGDWKNVISHLADDQDNNVHLRDQDQIAQGFWNTNSIINMNKIYFDAYEQITTSGGNFFPKVTEAINNSIYQGQLAFNYMGHGGPGGWAQERVLKTNHINSWTNINKLPLIVTATCTFTGYDDPTNTTAGELCILNKKGGAIGLFSTVRPVFTNSNKQLNQAVTNRLLVRDSINNKGQRIGEILRTSKISIASDSHQNNDKFQCIGDPSMRIKLPEYKVRMTSINKDTIGALDEVFIEGEIINFDSVLLSTFNGEIFTKIFDKKSIANTLGQDIDSPVRPFEQQNSILFKGISSVVDGKFTVSFVVPKDIDYSFGYGKISFYAHNNVDKEATGYVDDIVIGGTSSNPVQDDSPPIVDIYMNDNNFVSGGLTNSNPILIAEISDDYGINLATSSIGHELSGLLDNNFAQNYYLNNFYESNLNDSKSGTVTFPLQNISEGMHQIRVRAWDIANNFGDGTTDFLVVNSTNTLVSHVLNYPNPFFNNTSFQFEHNLALTELNVDINIYSVSGALIKTIQKNITPTSNRVDDIQWDGTDDYGDKLATGVYLYKVKIKGGDQSDLVSESEFQKLVILNK